ncbi:GNAT family N-acetyltransferase [Oscillibacter sp.]|uniref:GNAT family N-acetyltransferase n=1 Tax=Oscillibacter sp. TaxID=1945593 RepID=UPI003393F176
MLNFTPITAEHGDLLRRYYENCNYGLCEYSTGTKLMWGEHLLPAFTEAAGCLIVRNGAEKKMVFDYPVPGPEGDEDAALSAIEDWCMENGMPPVISVVPEAKAPKLLQRYPYAAVRNVRTWQDYLYKTEDLQTFSGRRYSGQRNHIKKFRTVCPDAEFRPLTAADVPLIDRFWEDYGGEFAKGDDPRAAGELKLAKRMIDQLDRPWYLCGGMLNGDKLISLALAERCGDTLIIHIEKALYSYVGVYPTMVQAFAQHFGGGSVWINREDDAADMGLRTSKLQYGPDHLAPKYHFAPQNELLYHVKAIPELKTARLTLSELTEEDIPAYNALVLDGERNRWWGYDDVAGLDNPMTERSFYEVTQRDFHNCAAVNFAIRLDGKLIGEAILYRFNYRGDAELGCRIAEEYKGWGFGTEAFAAAANWGLYGVHLTRIVAKCFKKNEASRKMLSSCMRPNGEDETYYYFEKLV